MPGEFVASRQQVVAQLLIASTVADVPLPGCDDLERAAAAFVELHRVDDRLGVAHHLAGGGEHLDHPLLGLLGGEAGDLHVRLAAHVGGDPLGHLAREAAVEPDECTRRQVQFAPPHHVGDVAERADHRDARALLGVGQGVGQDGHVDAEQWGAHHRAEQRLVTRIVGVGHHRHATGQQFGTCGGDEHVAATVEPVERELVVRARHLAVFHLGLGDGGAFVDVVEGGRVLLVRLAAGEVAQERPLAHPAGTVADGGVEQRPVDAEAQSPEQRLEGLFVDVGDLAAQVDEVRSAHRQGAVILRYVAVVGRSELGVERQ